MKLTFSKPKQIAYAIGVNLLIYKYYGETKCFTIRNPFSQYGLGLFFSILTLILGIWKFNFPFGILGNWKYVGEAFGVNCTGGIDYTSHYDRKMYGDGVMYVMQNLPKTIRHKTNLEEIHTLLTYFEDRWNEYNQKETEGKKQDLRWWMGRHAQQNWTKEELNDLQYVVEICLNQDKESEIELENWQ